MAIILREITGTVRKPNGDVWANAQIVFELISSIVADADAEAVYPRRKQAIDCDENGLIPTSGNVPTVIAGYTYKLHLPDGAYGNFVAPTDSAAALSIDEVIALIAGGAAEETEGYTGIPLAQADLLLDLYDAAQDADAGEVAEADGAGKVVFNGRVGLPTADAAWVATGAAGGPLGTAAYQDTGAFDAAGSAATVQGNLNTHTGMTGTAVHGLGSASTLTAGATGSSLVQAATVDAAREVIGLAAVSLPPRDLEHVFLTDWATENIVGTGAGLVVSASRFSLDSGANAGSTVGLKGGNFAALGYNNNFASWNRKIEFWGRINMVNTDAAGKIRLMFGKESATFGAVASGNYVGLEVVGANITSGLVCIANSLTTVALTSTSISSGGNFYIVSQNGAVSWYINGVLIGSSAAGPTATDRTGAIILEIENVTARHRATIWSKSREY